MKVELLAPPPWPAYELIDSGAGRKLERYGPYRLVRPESQAIWPPSLPEQVWRAADAVFDREHGGRWVTRRPLPEQWLLPYRSLAFYARLTPFRHTGIFPEHLAHWPWLEQLVQSRAEPVSALVLFGYTGLTTLALAHAGAHVCHVDASRPAVGWARANQAASGLEQAPVRWIVDDVLKFLAREQRRGMRYDIIVMDPPVFGRGPKGEVWRFEESFPELVERCVRVLTPRPLAVLAHAYATSVSAVTLSNVLGAALGAGQVQAGELVLVESTGQRMLPTALYARWSAPVAT